MERDGERRGVGERLLEMSGGQLGERLEGSGGHRGEGGAPRDSSNAAARSAREGSYTLRGEGRE